MLLEELLVAIAAVGGLYSKRIVVGKARTGGNKRADPGRASEQTDERTGNGPRSSRLTKKRVLAIEGGEGGWEGNAGQ